MVIFLEYKVLGLGFRIIFYFRIVLDKVSALFLFTQFTMEPLETNSFRMLQEVFIALRGFEVTYNGIMDCVFYCNSESLRNT